MSGDRLRLDVTATGDELCARLELKDGAGHGIARHVARLADGEAALWEGVLDTRRHVERYAESLLLDAQRATAETLLERIGVFLGARVLGGGIGAHLAQAGTRGTLDVRVDGAHASRLAAVFASVPFELARHAPGAPSLAELGYHVRVGITSCGDDRPRTLPAPGEDVRVLLVFSEALTSRPLAMRHERERLLQMFHDDVMPSRRVRVDVVCHGASIGTLRRQVRSAGGYHVLHWSGHGRHDGLLLQGAGGVTETLSGAGLVQLLLDAGGLLPHVVFLNACMSGTLAGSRDWHELRASLVRPGRRGRAAPVSVWELLGTQPGHTGTALGLLSAGVPHVVAMRYEVGDAYACDLSTAFYRHLFGVASTPCAPHEALARARVELRRQHRPEHDPVDHVTPVFLGTGLAALALDAPVGLSPSAARRHPHPQPLLPGSNDLDRPARFVGRHHDLARLREEWLETGSPAVALIQGLGGVGKTFLAAEAIHLWHARFDGVFCFQAKQPLGVEDFLRRLDERLSVHSEAYRARTGEVRGLYARVYLDDDKHIRGGTRERLLRDNLLAVLREERLLLVLDNFETLLEDTPGKHGHACADLRWDALLVHLAQGLPGSGSRVLLTSRHRPAALAAPGHCLWVALGSLPPEEALLLVQEHRALRGLFFSADPSERALAERLLETARGHAFILDRLARLAGDPAALALALDELRVTGLSSIPGVFAPATDDDAREREHAYLEDIAARSIDALIARLSVDAVAVLHILALALEPVADVLLAHVWTAVHQTPVPAGATGELLQAGLVQETRPRTWDCHELVREGMGRWSLRAAAPLLESEKRRIWGAYGEHYMLAFGGLEFALTAPPDARARSAEMGRRALAYLTRAHAFEWLGSVASALATSAQSRELLRGVITDLRSAADVAEPGKPRWSTRMYLADALHGAGRSSEAMSFYSEACAEAESAEHWVDVGWICHNWGTAWADLGNARSARELYRRSLEAKKRTDQPLVVSLATWLELDRLALARERVEDVLVRIERHLDQAEGWWRRTQAGDTVPEAPESVFLGRVLIGALDATYEAQRALERWDVCLDLLDRLERVKIDLGYNRLSLALTRFNRYPCLIRSRRLDEAQGILEECLEVFREAGEVSRETATLSALSEVWQLRGDLQQALALARQSLAVACGLAELEEIGLSHAKLAALLLRAGSWEEALRHYLAAILFDSISGRRRGLLAVAQDLAVVMTIAHDEGRACVVPSVTQIVARPEFAHLARLLTHNELTPELLQVGVDRFVEQVRDVVGLTPVEPDAVVVRFGSPTPALLEFPSVVVWLDAATLGVLSAVTGDVCGVWGEAPRISADGLPYVTESVKGRAGDFALWRLPTNQARVASYAEHGSDVGGVTLLLSVDTPVALLRALELDEQRHDRPDEHAALTALAQWIEQLGWVCISFDRPGHEALVVVAPRHVGWIDALEMRLAAIGRQARRPLRRDGRWLWPEQAAASPPPDAPLPE